MNVFGSGRVGGERIGFGLYQSCGNMEGVERVFVLWWCQGSVGLGTGSGRVVL